MYLVWRLSQIYPVIIYSGKQQIRQFIKGDIMKTMGALCLTNKTNLVVALVSALFLIMSLATVISAEDAAYVPAEILIGFKDRIAPDAIENINAQLGAEILYKYRIINAYQLRPREGLMSVERLPSTTVSLKWHMLNPTTSSTLMSSQMILTSISFGDCTILVRLVAHLTLT
jgi:hypothetical protein